MTEYQHIEFRAVDRPLTDKQLAFAEDQSSRAEVDRWSLSVEYHYSDFRGDVNKLLRGGYDVFLQYANYGVREIRLRLPGGLPLDKRMQSKYFSLENLTWTKDKRGPGGILTVCPFHESGDRDEVWDFGSYKSPKHWLDEASALAEARGRDNYKAAAAILADMQEAIGGDEGKKITRKHAAHLTKKHPTLTQLKGSLRKRGLLD